MKKLLSIFLSILLLFGICGCGFMDSKEIDMSQYSAKAVKSDRIDVIKGDERLDLISGHNNIEDFITNLKMEDWKIKDLPKDSKIDLEFVLYSNKNQDDEENIDYEFTQKGRIITYEDSRYLTFKLDNIEFHFKVPKDCIEYLNTFKN